MTQYEEKPNINDKNTNQPLDDDIIAPLDFQPASIHTATPAWRPSKWMMSVAGATLIALLILSYLFAAKSLYIHTNTDMPDIDVDGFFTVTVADRFLLLKGSHQVTIHAEGYHPYKGAIEVNSDTSQYSDIELLPLPGHLTVTTNTPAEVYVDDALMGTSNERLSGIEAGKHQLSLKAERYQTHEQSIAIDGRDLDQALEVTLLPNWADITFTTNPAGATLNVDGVDVGTTPLSAELLSGKREVTIKLAGHKSWRQRLRVKAQTPQDIPPIELLKADGLVEVASSPNDASVTVNGQYRGKTPVELALAPGQSYNITLFKDGYQAQHRQLTIVSGQEQALRIKLSPTLGDISISATPSDALLYVDGRLMGRANQTLTLPARKHTIRISKEGFADHSETVLPRQGLAQNLSVKLLTQEEYKWRNIKPEIQAATGQTLLLFKPEQTFTMGASRREQGRRANEAQRQIKLDRAFYISQTLTTNAQYRRFERFHSSGHVKGNSLNGEQYPVVNITWQQAAKYCNWLSQQDKLTPFYQVSAGAVTGFNPQANGYRLPTEAEWAWAARLNSGTMMKYRWGTQLPPDENSGNLGDRNAAPLLGAILTQYDDGFAVTSPVGKFPPNHHKLFDLTGNAAEWINDYYGIKTGLSLSVEANPMGPEKGDFHVIRGSSWAHASMTDLRLSYRDYSNDARNDVGFRVARFID